MKKRLKLENFIFSRAVYLSVNIIGLNGRLYCAHVDPYLQISVYLYNCLYAPVQITGFFQQPILDLPGGIKSGWILPSHRKR